MRYRQALASASRARHLARQQGRMVECAYAGAVMAALYSRFGQGQLARDAAWTARRDLPADAPAYHSASVLLLAAPTLYASGDTAGAESAFNDGAAIARSAGQGSLLASNLARMALHRIRRGDLRTAERELHESLQLYRAGKYDGAETCYYPFARLRLLQGRPREALEMLGEALKAAKPGLSRAPLWSLLYHRALARRGMGDFDGALQDFATSTAEIRGWREDAFPSDDVQTAGAVELSPVYASFVETGMTLYVRNGSEALARRMLRVSEEGRALALRLRPEWKARLPVRYWDVLARYRSARGRSMTDRSLAAKRNLRNLSTELVRIETQVGLLAENKSAEGSLANFRRRLKSREILISFHVGKENSWAWVVGKNTFEVRRLPGSDELGRLSAELRNAITESRDVQQAGARAWQSLFGSLQTASDARGWVLIPDGPLFELPFAALHDGQRWIVERTSIRIVPSASVRGGPAGRPAASELVALADPIYNTADPRYTRSRSTAKLQMARIPASAAELRTVARAWQGRHVGLTGRDVNYARISAELKRRPAVLHAATHVVAEEGSAVMALGYGRGGEPEWWDAMEIARLPAAADLVVLSGCHSARGAVLPGVGLTGLTRAWLLAGANAVAASRWPVADDSGALWRVFYARLRPGGARSGAAVAEALREAQVAMLRSGGAHADPRNWSAYFVVGRD